MDRQEGAFSKPGTGTVWEKEGQEKDESREGDGMADELELRQELDWGGGTPVAEGAPAWPEIEDTG